MRSGQTEKTIPSLLLCSQATEENELSVGLNGNRGSSWGKVGIWLFVLMKKNQQKTEHFVLLQVWKNMFTKSETWCLSPIMFLIMAVVNRVMLLIGL